MAHIRSVQIEYVKDDGSVVTLEKDDTYEWRISGPVFPRVLKLMSSIDDWQRAFDTPRKERKPEETGGKG